MIEEVKENAENGMKISKVVIKSLYGINDKTLSPGDVTIFEGANGAGKTSILDSIGLALTNKGVRPKVIKDDAEEGEIQIETSTGLNIHRKKRTAKSDYSRISQDNKNITSPEAYLKELFNSGQINPIEFIALSSRKQCEILLSMLKIDFTTSDYIKYFGMIPPDYSEDMHILEMLDYLQSDKSTWYKLRADENKNELFKRQSVEDNLAKLPEDYDCVHWENFKLSTISDKIANIKQNNQDIENCQNYIDSELEKKAKIDKDIDSEIETEKQSYFESKTKQNTIIENSDSEINILQERIGTLNDAKKEANSQIKIIESRESVAIEKIDLKRDDLKRTVDNKIEKSKEFVSANKLVLGGEILKLKEEYEHSETMQKHVTFYKQIMITSSEQKDHAIEAKKYEDLINMARELPIELMKTATCPIDGISVVNGDVLKDKKPIGNLSEGEQLLLAFDIAMNQVGELKIVLADGFEKLSKKNRDLFIERAKSSGLQFFITRVTDEEEMTIVEL